jgi:hypothetical protein
MMLPPRLLLIVAAILALLALPAPPAAESGTALKTRNVVLVLIDGLRWQEVFRGAEAGLMEGEGGGVKNPQELKDRFWRETAEERRAALLPFLTGTMAKQGQLFGNRDRGSHARLTNTFHFSYPGYSEMIMGFTDPGIDSNAKRPNPNVTVLEWLHRQPGFAGKVAAVGAWDVVPYIVNRERCGFFVNAGYEPITAGVVSPEIRLLNRLKAETTRPWSWGPYDGITFHSALEYLKANKPRLMWITFGETDEWAHDRRYDLYLESAYLTDGYLATLWETLQSLPQYRDQTTLIVGVDHGRGRTEQDWTSHGASHPGSDEIWLAAIGPDTRPLGERENVPEINQSQIAATVAALLGHNYPAAEPKAAPPIRDLLP